MKIRVGVLGRASGIHGEIRVALHTDSPQTRFTPGTMLLTDYPDLPRLTVKRARLSGKHFVVSFAEIPDRNAAEHLCGVKLLIETENEVSDTTEANSESDLETPESESGFYRHELVGLSAVSDKGEVFGEVSDLIIGVAQDLLEVRTPGGEKILVPFVFEIVPEVDLEAGQVIMTPPGRLFPEANAKDSAS